LIDKGDDERANKLEADSLERKREESVETDKNEAVSQLVATDTFFAIP
jgi:hypothetical protein